MSAPTLCALAMALLLVAATGADARVGVGESASRPYGWGKSRGETAGRPRAWGKSPGETAVHFNRWAKSPVETADDATGDPARHSEVGPSTNPRGMVRVAGGEYRPLYGAAAGRETVRPFFLDVTPVTNADFLAFVRANPTWRRSVVRPIFADAGYLSHWAGDLDVGGPSELAQPVVNVSWFAATAYARWRGRRLPTTAEWEFAAGWGPAGRAAAGARDIVAWYSRPRPAVLPPVGATPANGWGVRDLHGLVFEWVSDFTSVMVSADSRRTSDADRGAFCGAGALGASDFEDYPAFLRFAYRGGLRAAYAVPNLGFRTALDAR